MRTNINHMEMSSDNKLVREITRIIKEDEEKENTRQAGEVGKSKYKAVSRDGDTLEINGNPYVR